MAIFLPITNNAKKVLSEAQEQFYTKCEQIKSQISEVKEQKQRIYF